MTAVTPSAPAPLSHQNLPRLLLRAREAVLGHTRADLRGHGLSDPQWRVLRVLGEHGHIDTGRLAHEAHILGPSLTGVLARMEGAGLLSRRRDPADQRRSVVEATPRGLDLVATLTGAVENHHAWLESRLGAAKLAQLHQLLSEVIALEKP